MRRLFRKQEHSAYLSGAALTPMVDLFTILVIAILRASSPEPPTKTLTEELQLPISRSEIQSRKGASVEIGNNGISLEGIRVGSTLYWAKHEARLISDLKAGLLQISPTSIQIKAHGEVPWNVVNKAIYTAQQAGIKDVEIIAISASSL